MIFISPLPRRRRGARLPRPLLLHRPRPVAESANSSLKDWLADPAIGNNATLRLVAGLVFLHENDFNEALKYTNAGGTMELHALNVQIFIKMHRSDYAKRQLRIMQQMDEDHTLTQIANAWLDLAVGGSKIQEAYLIFQDLSERYQSTSLLLNGKAVCCMHMGNFDEAETFLVEALNKARFFLTYCVVYYPPLLCGSWLQITIDFGMVSIAPFGSIHWFTLFERNMINIHSILGRRKRGKVIDVTSYRSANNCKMY
uniref:Coatomer subunit epsilon-1 n=1 Tax=Cajanus cajan TaxID=3821 RepID=A0A151R5V0_CAJCA|nr:Coatomer subunit epsilon-1 [Cajanus cajan]